MEFDNNTILLIIIAVAMYYFFVYSKEDLTNDDEKQKLASLIKDKFNGTVVFENYKSIINMSGNKSTNLTTLQTFTALQELYKNNNLTEDAIKGFMNDI